MSVSSRIYLKNARFHAYHGVLPQERTVGNNYVVNLVVDYDFTDAMETDELSIIYFQIKIIKEAYLVDCSRIIKIRSI